MFLFHSCSVLQVYLAGLFILIDRSAMFSVTGSNSLYLEISKFFSIFEKKLFRILAVSDSVVKISPFSFTLILSPMRDLRDVSLISRIACYQLRFLYLSFHSILS